MLMNGYVIVTECLNVSVIITILGQVTGRILHVTIKVWVWV